MASNIDPTQPVQGRATTQSVRDNFQCLKDEIEALQVSTDPDGFKLTEATTTDLGAAAGGSSAGRIAYDLTKGVTVRDTAAGSPFWEELTQRRVRRGAAGSRPAYGNTTGAANLYYNTDTSTFQLDTGSAWIDIGPGGGAGGEGTLTENVEPSMGYGAYSTVTHPSVPLTGAGSGEIRFSVLGTTAGSSHSDSIYVGREMVDLNINSATWIQDPVETTKGKFSAAVSSNVVAGSWMFTGDYWHYGIVSIVGDGTGDKAVTLDAAVADSSIYKIVSMQGYDYGDYLNNTYVGAVYAQTPTLCLSYGMELYGTSEKAIGWLYGYSATLVNTPPVVVARAAFSLDNKATWITFNGTGWVSTTLVNLETTGLTAAGGGGYLLDSAGNAIPADDGTASPPEGWGTLRLLINAARPTASVWLVWGLRATANDYVGVNNTRWYWEETATISPLATSFSIERLTPTTTKFTNNTGITRTDVHCQVWTA